MGDVGDFWRDVKTDWKQRSKDKKWANIQNGEQALTGMKIPFEKKSLHHYVVGNKIDYWPSTGKYIVRKNNKSGRGLKNMVREFKNIEALEAL